MEEIHDVTADTSNGTEETVNDDELDLFIGQEEDVQEDVDALKERLKKTEEANKRLYARLKKEEKAPEVKVTKKEEEHKDIVAEVTMRTEEILLRDKGYDDEDIEQLKKLSKMNESSLIESSKDPLFVSFKTQKEEAEKRSKAQLGASKTGGGKQEKPMTPEEHKEFAKKRSEEILANF